MKKYLLFTVFFIATHVVFAQNDSIRTLLKEVVVVGDKAQKNKVNRIKKSIK